MSAPGPSADRNLLVGILALQLDFVGRDALIAAMHAWVLDKARPLGDILRDRGALSPEQRHLLSALVDEHLKRHGGDPRQSLAALPVLDPPVRQALESIADPDVRASVVSTGVADAASTRDALPSYVPQTIAPAPGLRYRVLRLHARGGLGVVYLAEDTELGRQVALKEIRPEYAGDPVSSQRFLLEAQVTGGLEHPGVVPVYGLGAYADGRPFYAMRFVKGDSLHDAIRRFHGAGSARGRYDTLAFRELLGRFVDVCQAVAYAHSRGVLHRDLKPANVMLGKYGETLLVDWGLAKPVGRAEPTADGEATLLPRSGAESSGTVMGQVLGTPAYMAPEQAAGRLDELGPAADVYSLGATLYELLTGRVAFPELDLEAVEQGHFPPPRRVVTAVPPALEAVCLKAMAHRPADRYATAQDLAADIEHWLADEPVTAYREPPSARAWRWVRRHRALVSSAAALLLTAAVGLAVGVVLISREQARTAQERDAKELARQAAVDNEQQALAARNAEAAARKQTRQALNTMTDDVVERLFARQARLGDTEQQFLRKVQQFYEEFAASGGDSPEARESRADGLYRVGVIRHRLGDVAGAETSLRDALTARARLAADFSDVTAYRAALATSYGTLGNLLVDAGQPEKAKAAYRDALTVLTKLAEDAPDVAGYRAARATNHNNLGNILVREPGRRAEAEAEYRAALALRVKLAEDFPKVAVYRSALAISHHNLGNFLLAEPGRRAEAEAAYRDALAARAKLAADFPDVPGYRAVLATTHNNLGALLSDAGRPQDAETEYRAALDLQTKLAAEFPAVPDHANHLAATLGNLANLAYRRKDYAQARRWLEQAMPHHRTALQANPRQPDYRLFFRNTTVVLTATLVALGDHAAAAAKAEELAGLDVQPADDVYQAVGCLARCAPLAAKDSALDENQRKELTETYGRRAVVLLRQAFVKGHADLAHVLKDAELDALRARADFADLLWDLADAPAPRPAGRR